MEETVDPKIVSREEWMQARLALLAREREATHLRDAVNAERRALPWVRVETDYVFDTPEGPASLADLFDGRAQLFVQHFMLPPGGAICDGCAGTADMVDAARQHFEHADLSYVAVSRAPVAEIEAARQRLGWTFRWVSCGGNGFNHDFGTAFTPEQIAAGEVAYNYGTTPYAHTDLPGVSVFARGRNGAVFHTYSAYSRGMETLFAPFAFLDLVPKGRNEAGTMSWLRLHDEYAPRQGTAPAADCSCRSPAD
jgi:predicted dithiol-disulfide oxidoreductase (DUF899 family)